jgi:hypothetical protein
VSFFSFSIAEATCLIMWVMMTHPVFLMGNFKLIPTGANYPRGSAIQILNVTEMSPENSVENNKFGSRKLSNGENL